MSRFVKFSQDEIDRAAHTDIRSILHAKGQTILKSGSEWMWGENKSVKFRGHVFYDHSTGEKGTAIDFVCTFFNMRFQDAVCTLNCKEYNGVEFTQAENKKRERHVFKLPQKSRNMKRVYAYLMQERHISPDIISFFVHARSLYESANTHNAVFVGYDSVGNAKAAHERGTLTQRPYRGDVSGSEKDYFFNYYGGSNRIYVFEAPIDMLSFITLYKERHWQKHNYIALGGTAGRALFRFLFEYPKINQVVLCLDNDKAGQNGDKQIKNTLERLSSNNFVEDVNKQIQQGLRRNYKISTLKSTKKDWNEDVKEIFTSK